jgi:hypothetical protein
MSSPDTLVTMHASEYGGRIVASAELGFLFAILCVIVFHLALDLWEYFRGPGA